MYHSINTAMYSDISRRLALLRNEVSTYRLKKDYPPAEHLLNYVKFDRRVPNAFKEQ